MDECIYGEQKPTNKVDPKFHKGYDSIKAGIQAHAETYSFNIESLLFNQLTKEQQVLWRKEIESAFNNGYNQAEKDNELTWEDIKKIEILCFKVDIECNLEEKEHYQEVLKRFKEKKGGKV